MFYFVDKVGIFIFYFKLLEIREEWYVGFRDLGDVFKLCCIFFENFLILMFLVC